MNTSLVRKLSALCVIVALVATSWVAYAGEGCCKSEKKGCQVKEKQCEGEKKEACKEKEGCAEKKDGCNKKDAKACPAK